MVPKVFRSMPVAPGSAEHTLNRVGHPNWYLDLRTAPSAARTWHPEPPLRPYGSRIVDTGRGTGP
ncbi:hypothetical protein GCM10017779_61410 [Streptomyces capillispiralis]|uniref:Uncharacterized protein n=1 Tax=Streptomyces capillispiralis TaxID=68182 RepID=A0A561TRY3_9ACTN|nr:hypothetical protein FHX78_116909 [Streptomyces capillispiralis]GHH95684.1 hypothetical protein GCM10017779_61410 [Streptomyces capillispiralis]